MLKKPVLDALNKQIQQELMASYNYTALSIWFDQQLLKGFSEYFKKQAEEEREHANKILEYIQDHSEVVTLGPLAAPRQEFGNAIDALKFARENERNNTASIHNLYNLTVKEGDLATQQMMGWFISEQVEEEKWAEDFVAMAEQMEGKPNRMMYIDHRVSKLAMEED